MSITIMVMPSCLGASGFVRDADDAGLDARRVGACVPLAEQLAPDHVLVQRRQDPAGDLLRGTADALHTQARLVGLITRELGAYYVFTVKGNQKTCLDAHA